MGIFRETKEEVLANEIKYATSRSNDVVISAEQKEMDFDEQVLTVLTNDQEPLKRAVTKCSENLTNKSEKVILEAANPTQVDQLLRISFWEELTNALTEGRKISERAIYNGVCSHNYWNRLRDVDEDKFTYILIPIKSYSRTNKLLLTLGQECLINILNADPYIKAQGSGNKKVLDPRIAKVQLEAYKMVEERIYGKAVNRIQTHNTNENTPSNANDTIDALKAEIVLLENKAPVMAIEVNDVD
jgi:hypothetical protein